MMRALFGVRLLDAGAARQHVVGQLDVVEPGSDEIAVLFDVMAIGDAAIPMPTKNTAARRHMLIELISSAMKARRARTVFIVEDLHWVDAASDEFLAELAAMLWSTDSDAYRELPAGIPRPTARYVGNDDHALPTGSVDHRRPRGRPDRGAARLHPVPLELIAQPSAGNPFFVEEIVRDLVGRSVLAGIVETIGSYAASTRSPSRQPCKRFSPHASTG